MRPHSFAVINTRDQDAGMELLAAALLLAIVGVLAQLGTDSRDSDTRIRPNR